MKQVTLPIFLFLVSLWFVACAPGTADRPQEAVPEEAASAEVGSETDPATTTATATTATTMAGEAGAQEGAATAAPTEEPATTQPPAATEAPPTDPPPSPTVETAESAGDVAVNGRTPEGAYFLGRADAPVTIIDYSDFM